MFPSAQLPQGIMQDLKRVIKIDGYYGDNGVWIDGTENLKPFKGSILPITSKDLQFDQSGTYSADNVKLYTYEDFSPGQILIDTKGQRFRIDKAMEYSPYANNISRYVLIRVGVTEQ